MPGWLVPLAIAAGVLVVIRLVVPLPLRAGLAFVWLAFGPMLFGLTVMLVLVVPTLWQRAPVLAALVALPDVVLIVVTVRALTRLGRARQSGQTRDQLGTAMLEAIAEPAIAYLGMVLVAAVLGVVALLVWVVISGGQT